MKAISLVVGVLVGLVSSSVFAQADPQAPKVSNAEQVEALYAEGAALYKSERYREAIDRFERAYALFPEPNLLYNIARAHEALGQTEEAISVYERFLAQENIASSLKAKAERKLKVLKEAKLKSAVQALEPPPEPAKPAKTPSADVSSKPVDNAPALSNPTPATTVETQSGGSGRVWGWVLGATAVAAVAAGGVVFGLGFRDHQKVDDAKAEAGTMSIASLSQVEADDLISAGSTKKTAGVAVMGGGAALGVISAIIFFASSDPEPSLQASAAPVHQGAVFSLNGVF